MKIDLTQLTGKLLELAKNADKNSGTPNGIYLDNEKEISLFTNSTNNAVKNGEIAQDDVNAIFGLERTSKNNKTVSQEDIMEAVYVENLSREQKEEVTGITKTKTDSEYIEMANNLDSMLIENEITGLGAILNRLPAYDLNKLADRYIKMQDKYNEVLEKVENWYKAPDAEKFEIEDRKLFEEKAEEILGMPYQEYSVKYKTELEEVAKIPPIIRGVSSIAEIIRHEEAVAKLSETGLQVYRAISTLNSVLAVEFNAWENDIRYNANEKTSRMSMDIIDSINTVEMNEYTGSEYITQEFEWPENWLVKKNFIQAIEEVSRASSSIDSIQSESAKKTNVRKIIKGKQVIIEKTTENGNKIYYNLSGKQIK